MYENTSDTEYRQTSEPSISTKKSESVQQKQASQDNRNCEFSIKSSVQSQNTEMDTEIQGKRKNDGHETDINHNNMSNEYNEKHIIQKKSPNLSNQTSQTNQTQEHGFNQNPQISAQSLAPRQNMEMDAKMKIEEQARALLQSENRLKSISGSIEIEKADVNRSNVQKYTELLCKRFNWARQQDLSKIMSINDMYWSNMRTSKMTIVSDSMQMQNKIRMAQLKVELLSQDVFRFSIYCFRREIENKESFLPSLFGGKKDPALNELCKLFNYNYDDIFAFILNEAANN